MIIDKQKITLRELEELVKAGDKDAIEYWEKEIAPAFEGLRNAFRHLFDETPAKPLVDMLEIMARSENPVHRSISRWFDDVTITELKERGSKYLLEEMSKSAVDLPATKDNTSGEVSNELQELFRAVDNAILAVEKEKKRRETTPNVKPIYELLNKMMNSDNPIARAIAKGMPYPSIYEMAKSLDKEIISEFVTSYAPGALQVNFDNPERPKQKGRYRLTPEEIKRRKRIVKEAIRLFNQADPKKTWKQIAYELDIPERTLRDWRHNPQY